MLKFKINVGDALNRVGFTSYKAKTTGLLSQDTLKKIRQEDMSISLKSLNAICNILDLQPKDILEFERNEEDKNNLKKL